tara:strand:+ start:361 stop:1401 length:1041 start_codon:yes stop_codon:yes gene_type:complete
MLLSSNDLPAYMGHVPHFWKGDTKEYLRMPDSVAGFPAIASWRDVCASMCLRMHDDDVEMIQVDLRPGLYTGDMTNEFASKCDCYAYSDTANRKHAPSNSEMSHEAPNDIAMGRFLSTAKLVNNYVGKGNRDNKDFIPDLDLHYRQFINTYAVHREPWDSYFDSAEQSSVFYRLALESGYSIESTFLSGAYRARQNIDDLNGCMHECIKDYRHRMNFSTMVFTEGSKGADNCWCFDKNLLHPNNDSLIVRIQDRALMIPKVYSTKLCVGVAGGSERSVVYRKGVKGPNSVCMGMPVGSGMILSNGSVFLSRDASDDTRPIDTQCRAACDRNDECALAHSFVRARAA